MSVTIPTAFVVNDLNDGAGVSPGIPILESPVQTIASNHNFMRANFTPPIFYAMKGAGFSHTAGSSTFKNMIIGVVPGHDDAQGITVSLIAKVSSGTGVIRVYLGGSYQTISYTDTSYALKTVTFAASSTSPFLLKVGGTGLCNIACVLAYWTPYAGSISDTIQDSGFRWCQNSEFANTEPLTVEQANRFLEMPRLVAAKSHQSLFHAYGNLMDASGFAGTPNGNHTTVHRNKLIIKNKCQISWALTSVGPSSSETKIILTGQDFESTVSTIAAPGTALPANPSGSFASLIGTSTMSEVQKGSYDLEIKMKSGTEGVDHILYSIRATLFPPG